MVLAYNRTFKDDSKENSIYEMLELFKEMTKNKDSKPNTTVVKHNKIKTGVKLSAPNSICNDYKESFLTLLKPVGRTHNDSSEFKGKKTKKD